MHRMDYVSHHFFNTVTKNDVHVIWLISDTFNLKKIVNSNVKCRSLWCIYEWDLFMVNISVHWVIACSIVGTHSSRKNSNPLPRTKWRGIFTLWSRFNGNNYYKARALVFQWDLLKLYKYKVRWILTGYKRIII
jgi:hypothetical protein